MQACFFPVCTFFGPFGDARRWAGPFPSARHQGLVQRRPHALYPAQCPNPAGRYPRRRLPLCAKRLPRRLPNLYPTLAPAPQFIASSLCLGPFLGFLASFLGALAGCALWYGVARLLFLPCPRLPAR